MVIKNLRLKNVRSYAATAEGRGIEVCFEPGINRIAGKNGSGKSTLIEAIGYALFEAEPPHEENFRLDTYFLRSGEKSGSIEIEFSCAGSDYRIERGIGQHRLRTKIIRLEDGFTEAEGDEETGLFLCRLMGVPDRVRLAEGFTKLIGIKQGRLAQPFDSPPKIARAHFDPLLDVEIFRECFDRLLPVQRRLEELQQELEVQKGALDERIRERQNSCAEKEQAERRYAESNAQWMKASQALASLTEQREAFVLKDKQIKEAEKRVSEAKAARDLAAEIERNALEQFKKTEEAVRIVSETKAMHETYIQSEASIKQLQERLRQKTLLEKNKAASEKLEASSSEKAAATHAQAEKLSIQLLEQRTTQQKRIEQFRADGVRHEEALQAFEKQMNKAQKDQEAYALLQRWLGRLTQDICRSKQLADQLSIDWQAVTSWQPNKIAEAQSSCLKAREQCDSVKQETAVARERREALERQMKQIRGGVCPFLQEPCRQFDPDKVTHDRAGLDMTLVELKAKLGAADKALELSEKVLVNCRAEERRVTEIQRDLQNRWRQLLDLYQSFFDAEAFSSYAHLVSILSERNMVSDLPSCLSLSDTEAMTDNPAAYNAALTEAIVQACRSIGEQTTHLLKLAHPEVTLRIISSESARNARAAETKRLEMEEHSIKSEQQAIDKLTLDIRRYQQEFDDSNKTVLLQRQEINRLTNALKIFDGVEIQLEQAHKLKESCQEAHEKYLGAAPAAAEIAGKQQELERAAAGLKTSDMALAAGSQRLVEFKSQFDEEMFVRIQNEWLIATSKAAQFSEALKYAKQILDQAILRHQEWKSAMDSQEKIVREINHKKAACQILDKSRSVLKRAAPVVAQSLCDRIALSAQEIFNRLNHEPALVGWDASGYSVRVNPGPLEKRFAMLSGGEQTKLALAMNLALLHEFLNCKFLVFDEPTYGADEESRRKIAEAVVSASHYCRFEQLLLVSHDNVFDGKIENVVELEKFPGTGSRVVTL